MGVVQGVPNNLHLPCLSLIRGHGIVQRQQYYELTCEDEFS